MGLSAESAGVKAGSGVNPDALKVMAEIGIDISTQYSKAIDSEKLPTYDAVISMCSVKTADFCPSTFIGTQANWNIEDPKGQAFDVFRRVRDEIKAKVDALSGSGSDSAGNTNDMNLPVVSVVDIGESNGSNIRDAESRTEQTTLGLLIWAVQFQEAIMTLSLLEGKNKRCFLLQI